MGYKKQEWFELKRNGIMFELTVRDQDFKKLETIEFKSNNFSHTMKEIGNRYGISKEHLTPNKEIQDEMKWLRKKNII
ncbi:hypothetical protein BMS3Abin17_00033 [archaeon BMS3Abin17]|nr:hypothetical protein BMS3Abin17_00033 [archaeon BMS3Abin17]